MKLLKTYIAENGSIYHPGEYELGHLPLVILNNPEYIKQKPTEKKEEVKEETKTKSTTKTESK